MPASQKIVCSWEWEVIDAISKSVVAADATRMLKAEPPEGALRKGEHVLVDDGSCPVGQIKEVTRIGQSSMVLVAAASRLIPHPPNLAS